MISTVRLCYLHMEMEALDLRSGGSSLTPSLPLSSLSHEALASPSLNGKAGVSSFKGLHNHCAYKSTSCFQGCSLCSVCLIPAFCPGALDTWQSEAGVFFPAVWSRAWRSLKLGSRTVGSSFYFVQTPLGGLHHPALGLVSEAKESQTEAAEPDCCWPLGL